MGSTHGLGDYVNISITKITNYIVYELCWLHREVVFTKETYLTMAINGLYSKSHVIPLIVLWTTMVIHGRSAPLLDSLSPHSTKISLELQFTLSHDNNVCTLPCHVDESSLGL